MGLLKMVERELRELSLSTGTTLPPFSPPMHTECVHPVYYTVDTLIILVI